MGFNALTYKWLDGLDGHLKASLLRTPLCGANDTSCRALSLNIVRYNFPVSSVNNNSNVKVGPCCSNAGWCGGTAGHCNCAGCIDYRHGRLSVNSKNWLVQWFVRH